MNIILFSLLIITQIENNEYEMPTRYTFINDVTMTNEFRVERMGVGMIVPPTGSVDVLKSVTAPEMYTGDIRFASSSVFSNIRIVEEANQFAIISGLDIRLQPTAGAMILFSTLVEYDDFLGDKIRFFSDSYKIGISAFDLDITSDHYIKWHSDTNPDAMILDGDTGDLTIEGDFLLGFGKDISFSNWIDFVDPGSARTSGDKTALFLGGSGATAFYQSQFGSFNVLVDNGAGSDITKLQVNSSNVTILNASLDLFSNNIIGVWGIALANDSSPSIGDRITYGAGGITTWEAAGGGTYTDEQAQDAVGNMWQDTDSIDITYNDTNALMQARIPINGVTDAGMDYSNITLNDFTDDLGTNPHTIVFADLTPGTADGNIDMGGFNITNVGEIGDLTGLNDSDSIIIQIDNDNSGTTDKIRFQEFSAATIFYNGSYDSGQDFNVASGQTFDFQVSGSLEFILSSTELDISDNNIVSASTISFGTDTTGSRIEQDPDFPDDILKYTTAGSSSAGHKFYIGSGTPNQRLAVSITQDNLILSDASITNAKYMGFDDQTSDPPLPGIGQSYIWQSDGNGLGDDGDVMFKIRDQSGTTKTGTLIDFSALP